MSKRRTWEVFELPRYADNGEQVSVVQGTDGVLLSLVGYRPFSKELSSGSIVLPADVAHRLGLALQRLAQAGKP